MYHMPTDIHVYVITSKSINLSRHHESHAITTARGV